MTTEQESAVRDYRQYWRELRAEAARIAKEAAIAPGPLTAAKLRHQAALVDQYAVIAHHAAWREEHPEEPAA